MTTSSKNRRTLVSAARAAMSSRVDAVGDLGEADAARTAARGRVVEARARAAELVERATQQGRDLVQQVRDEVAAADAAYATAHAQAVAAGWSTRELRSLGLGPPPRAARRADGWPDDEPSSDAAPAPDDGRPAGGPGTGGAAEEVAA